MDFQRLWNDLTQREQELAVIAMVPRQSCQGRKPNMRSETQIQTDELQVQRTPQESLSVVNQFIKLGCEAGLQIEGKTVEMGGVSIIVYRVRDAHLCPTCGHANLGTKVCNNTQCPCSEQDTKQ